MPNLILQRLTSTSTETVGVLIFNNKVLCNTLELPWRDNERRVSCIPAGSYICQKYSGTRHKNCFWVDAVPNRTDILIHEGNTTANTAGCILVGELRDSVILTKSLATLAKLNVLLPFKFTLIVKDV